MLYLPKISIIFPVYNGWKETQDCLNSLTYSDYPQNKIEIIVVDNCSTDRTPNLIKRKFPRVKLILNKSNFGFAKAVNQGMKKATGEYLLITNNDIVFEKNYLKNMAGLAKQKPQAAIISGKVYLKSNRKKVVLPGFKTNPYLVYHFYDKKDQHKVRECDSVSGNNMFMSRKLIGTVGYFDQGYFFYFEDLDYCLRAKKLGHQIWYNPEAICYHAYGATAFKDNLPKIIYQGYKSRWRCVFKNANFLQITTSILIQFIILLHIENIISGIKTYKPAIKGFIYNVKRIEEIIRTGKSLYLPYDQKIAFQTE